MVIYPDSGFAIKIKLEATYEMSVNEKLKKAAQESKRYFQKIENESRADS